MRIDRQGVVLRPNGPGASSDWDKSGSGGANWDRMDEATPDATTYVVSSTPGASDLYALQDLTQAGTIASVTARGLVPAPCEKEDYWAKIRLQVDSGSATYAYADGPTEMNTLTSVNEEGVITSFAYDGNENQHARTCGTTRPCYDGIPRTS